MRLALNGTNPGLFEISVHFGSLSSVLNFDMEKSMMFPISELLSGPLFGQNSHSFTINFYWFPGGSKLDETYFSYETVN